jgi:hypothetical protein
MGVFTVENIRQSACCTRDKIEGMDWHLQCSISRRHRGKRYARRIERVVTLLNGGAGPLKLT